MGMARKYEELARRATTDAAKYRNLAKAVGYYEQVVGQYAKEQDGIDASTAILSLNREVVQLAGKAPSTLAREARYKTAVEAYNLLMRQYDGYPTGAQAAFELGNLYQTAKGKARDPKASYEAYTSLLHSYRPGDRFDRSRFDQLEDREIDQIQSLVKKAEVEQKKVAELANKENAKHLNYKILDFFVAITGRIPWFSYWFAIVVVTLIVKILITPLTKKQFSAMKEMQKVAPLVKQIQEEYKGDQRTIGEKTMQLYKDHHINPFASCLPVLIQMPILFLLFYMIRSYEFQFAKGTFLWIGSPLSHLYSFAVGGKPVWITAGNLSEADAILVVLYLISMYISTKMSNVDPSQADQQKMMAIVMPVMFAFIFAGFPSAFLLYWLVFNIIQTAQQYMILHGGQQEAQTVPSTTPLPPSGPEGPDEGDEGGDGGERVRRRRRRR